MRRLPALALFKGIQKGDDEQRHRHQGCSCSSEEELPGSCFFPPAPVGSTLLYRSQMGGQFSSIRKSPFRSPAKSLFKIFAKERFVFSLSPVGCKGSIEVPPQQLINHAAERVNIRENSPRPPRQ